MLKTKAFSPPPSSSGAFSSTEKPSELEPTIISPRGNASYIGREGDREMIKEGGGGGGEENSLLVSRSTSIFACQERNISSEIFAALTEKFKILIN